MNPIRSHCSDKRVLLFRYDRYCSDQSDPNQKEPPKVDFLGPTWGEDVVILTGREKDRSIKIPELPQSKDKMCFLLLRSIFYLEDI